MQDVFCGIDWGGYHHQLCAVNAVGQRLVDRRLAHDREGLEELRMELSRLGETTPVAVERAEGMLVELLLSWGHLVYPVSPRIAARSRERYRVAPSKDDGFDAFVLADSLRHEHDRWRPLGRPSATLAEIRSLVRDRRRVLETQQGVEAQLRSTLEAYHPAAARLFSSIDRDITLAFIRTYSTPEQAARVGEVRMDRFLHRNSYRGRVPADILVQRLRANLLACSEGTTAGKRHAALGQVDLLELLNRQLREFDSVIEAVLARHPNERLFRSFPGVATILAATFLGEIGEDRARYPAADVLLAEAGLAPVTRSSGRTIRVRFRYAANATMREAFMWWAYNSIKVLAMGPERVRRRERRWPASLPRSPRVGRSVGSGAVAMLAGRNTLRPRSSPPGGDDQLDTPASDRPSCYHWWPPSARLSAAPLVDFSDHELTVGVCRVHFMLGVPLHLPGSATQAA